MNGPAISRTPAQIALSRGIETATSVGIVGAGLNAILAFQDDLTKCIAPAIPAAVGTITFLGCSIGLRGIIVAFIVAVISGVVQYTQARLSAMNNVAQTGTTAPALTLAAPSTDTASDGKTVVTATPKPA